MGHKRKLFNRINFNNIKLTPATANAVTAGTLTVTDTKGSNTITLDGTYASINAMASDINTELALTTSDVRVRVNSSGALHSTIQ